MSTLRVDNLQGQTADNIGKYVVQVHYDDPITYGITSTSGFDVNNATTRGTASLTFTRKQANSFFLIKAGCTVNRGGTSGEFKVGYRLNSGSDVVTYCTDNDRAVRVFVEYQDTTTGSIGDTVAFESVFVNTASQNDNVSRISFSVMEIAK
jgi:hypothetical protein